MTRLEHYLGHKLKELTNEEIVITVENLCPKDAFFLEKPCSCHCFACWLEERGEEPEKERNAK